MKKNRYISLGRPLTDEDLGEFAPSVLNKKGPLTKTLLHEEAKRNKTTKKITGGVSDKYEFFPTINLVNDLRSIGWLPYAVEQRQVYKENRKDFTKHMVVFENPVLFDPQREDIEYVPQIIVTNSHDGRNSFEFYAGIWVKAKETFFVIYDTTLEEFRVRHKKLKEIKDRKGYDFNDVQNLIMEVIKLIPKIYEQIKLMQTTYLTEHEKKAFAINAVQLRWEEGKEKIDIEEVIKPIRSDERESTLWNLVQTLQDKIVNGGVIYEIDSQKKNKETNEVITVKRKQTARALENIDQKIQVKKTLWKISIIYLNHLLKEKEKHSKHLT